MDYFVMGCVPDGKSGHQILRCPEKKLVLGLESSHNKIQIFENLKFEELFIVLYNITYLFI